MSTDGDTVRAFLEHNGYEIVALADGSRSAFPMDNAEALAALARLEAAARDHEDQEWNLLTAQRDALAEALRTLDPSIERMLRQGHDFWEKHQHSPESDEMSGALTDLYMALKRARAALAEAGLE